MSEKWYNCSRKEGLALWFIVVDLLDCAPCGSLDQALRVAASWSRESALVAIVRLGGGLPAAVVAEFQNGRRCAG